jgi:RHS repeat-associated protein
MPTTNYIWDDENYVAETDGNNVVQTVYTNEPEQYGNLISSRISGTTSYHHFDAIGSTRQLTNSAGNVTDTVIYDAWGTVVSRTGTTGIAFLWIAVVEYYFDVETGQIYIRERTYEPVTGRWRSVDPLWSVLGLPNGYRYVVGNLVLLVDPSGLQQSTQPQVSPIWTWTQAAQKPTGIDAKAPGFQVVVTRTITGGLPWTRDWFVPYVGENVVGGEFVRAKQAWQVSTWTLYQYYSTPGAECNADVVQGATLDVANLPAANKLTADDTISIGLKTGEDVRANVCAVIWTVIQTLGFNSAHWNPKTHRSDSDTITPAKRNVRLTPENKGDFLLAAKMRGPYLATQIQYAYVNKANCDCSCMSVVYLAESVVSAYGGKVLPDNAVEYLLISQFQPTSTIVGTWSAGR